MDGRPIVRRHRVRRLSYLLSNHSLSRLSIHFKASIWHLALQNRNNYCKTVSCNSIVYCMIGGGYCSAICFNNAVCWEWICYQVLRVFSAWTGYRPPCIIAFSLSGTARSLRLSDRSTISASQKNEKCSHMTKAGDARNPKDIFFTTEDTECTED